MLITVTWEQIAMEFQYNTGKLNSRCHFLQQLCASAYKRDSDILDFVPTAYMFYIYI